MIQLQHKIDDTNDNINFFYSTKLIFSPKMCWSLMQIMSTHPSIIVVILSIINPLISNELIHCNLSNLYFSLYMF